MPEWPVARRYPRFEFGAPVAVLIERPGETVTLRGNSRDLSEGGLGAHLPLDLEPNQEVLLEVRIETLTPIRVRARVAHRRGSLHGFEFLQERPIPVPRA